MGDTGDTGDTGGGSACTASDLLWEAEVRDAAGMAGVLFGPRDDLTMAAVVRNPCANDIVFQTPDTCLTNSWSVTDSSGMGMGVAVACAPAVTQWTVPAGGTVEEIQPWGRLRVERYVLDVQFNFRMGIGAQENFEVQ